MGQEHSKSEASNGSFLNNFRIIKKVQDTQNGEYMVVEDISTKEMLLGQEYSYTNEIDFKNNLKFFEELKEFNVPTVISLKNIHSKIQNEFCSKFFKIYLFTEAYDHTLQVDVQSRMQNLKKLTEFELISFLLDVAQALADLKGVGLAHQDIRTSNIFVSHGRYKLGDPRIFKSSNSFMQVKSNFIQALYSNIFTPEDDAYKSDIFSLGILTLMIGTLEPIDHIYNYEHASIDGNGLDMKIKNFQKKYSNAMTDVVLRMLEEDELQRISAQELIVKLNSLGSTANSIGQTYSQENVTLKTEESRVNVSELNKLMARVEQKLYDPHSGVQNTISSYQPTIGKEPYSGAKFPNQNSRFPNSNSISNPIFNQSANMNYQTDQFRLDTVSKPSGLSTGMNTNFNSGLTNTPLFQVSNSSVNNQPLPNVNLYQETSPNSNSFSDLNRNQNQPISHLNSKEDTTSKEYNQRRVDEIIESIKKRTQEMKGELGVKDEHKIVSNEMLYKPTNFQQSDFQSDSRYKSNSPLIQNSSLNQIQYQNTVLPSVEFSTNRNFEKSNEVTRIQDFSNINPNAFKWENNWEINKEKSHLNTFIDLNRESTRKLENERIESFGRNEEINKVVDNSYLDKDRPNTISDYFSSRNSTLENKKVVEIYPNGSRYEGFKVNGLRHGHGILFYVDGGFYDGEWKFNKMNGKGKLYYVNGQLAYEGGWKDDRFEGYGVLHNEEPEAFSGCFNFEDFNELEDRWIKYEGDFLDDNKHGKGKLFLSNGEVLEGNFKDDLVDGESSFFMLNGDIVQGKWVQNQLLMRFE